MRNFARVMVATLASCAVVAAPAVADSLVYIRDGNVWLANPDGSGQFQVTLDGTADAPYESPSSADDGTIVAVRKTPGQRRRLYRMTQSGQLLNPPVDTPAPGTGAIDAKVSPDGRFVAYWFVTTVSGSCPFCVDTASRVLISHADRFTGPAEVGTPNTGGLPSWIGNDTLTLGSGSPTQWYYRLGMPEAAEWFADSDVADETFPSLLDAEAAPSGDRLAVVRGDSQESIMLLRMNGAPPAKPAIANDQCALLTGPSGSFADPTWSGDGRTLAWQEDDGVWAGAIAANLADCGGMGPFTLRIAGATSPDFGRAGVNPGPRPGCANPGNPAPCTNPPKPPPPCCSPPPDGRAAVRKALRGLARSLGPRLKARELLRRGGVAVAFKPPSAGTLAVRIAARRTVLMSGGRKYKAAKSARVKLRLTRAGKKRLRRVRKPLAAGLRMSFKPSGGTAVSISSSVRIKR